MMYQELKDKQRKVFEDFPKFFAFNNKELEKGKEHLKVDKNSDLLALGTGAYIRKTDREKFKAMVKGFRTELKQNIDADKDGTGFITSMFYYELENHEYSYSRDPQRAFDALGLSWADVVNNDNLTNGFELAKNKVVRNDGE